MGIKPKILPPNNLIASLNEAAKQYPRTEKILIVPDRATGYHILQNLARSGAPWINFDVATVTVLAKELVEEALIAGKLQAISPVGAQAVVDSVFNELADSGQLKYFQKHPVNKGIVEALTRTVRELRLSGIASDSIKKGCLIKSAKEADIRLILSGYEKALEEQRLVDGARLIMLAIEKKKRTDRRYFILSRHYMRGIEREFIELLCGKDLTVIGEDPAIGLPLPSDMWLAGKAEETHKCGSDIERLRWLFDSKAAPALLKDGTIELFNAIGSRNEAREVLRRISVEGVTVDDTEIIYTSTESYADLLYSLCEKLRIPVTFSEGMSSYLTGAGRTMMGFLLWVKEDFNEEHLSRILDLGFLLRTSGVGWGRDRYSSVLEGKIKEATQVASDLRKEGEVEDADRKDEKARNLAVLKAICEGLLKLVPLKDKDDKIDFKEFCEGCVTFLEKHVKKVGDNDAAFIEIAKERLAMLGGLIKGPMVFDEAMEKVFNVVSGIRVGASNPKPGHLHVSHYRSGGRSGRGRTFIIGLDEGKFPAKAGQDPILLDEEREKISGALELSTDRMRKNLYDMAALMAGLRGKATFSYAAYDIKEDRKAFPSSILLQVFRIKEGTPGADYDTMLKSLGDPVGFDESPAGKAVLDETDWWLNKLVADGVLKDGIEAVQDNYEGIKEGLIAGQSRASDKLTEYDGKVTPHDGDLDPRQNKEMVMSCSRLEAAAECPFAYFVANVLRVRKPDQMEKDTGAWLTAADRGKLLHEVFQVFIDELIARKKPMSAAEEIKAIGRILDESIAKYKDMIPPPSDIVFQSECTQLKRDVGVFLQINKDLGTEPIGTEVCFGNKEDDIVKISLGNGKSIALRGKIDRIDKAGPSEYHVWDYKTGGTWGYEETGYVVGGEQIQHALYSAAAEAILKKRGEAKDPKVTASGYIFPTEKGTKDGKGGIFPRATDDKDKWREVMDKLLDVLATGTFIVNNKDAGCIFCDYGDICGTEKARSQIAEKLKNPDNKALEAWLNLKACE